MNDAADRELTLRDYARVIIRRKMVVILAVVGTVGAAITMSALQTPVYEAESQMLVQTRANTTVFDNGSTTFGDPSRAVQTEIKVLESQFVAERVQENLGLNEIPPDVKGTAEGDTDVVSVIVRSGDPTTARIVADAYVQAYIELKRDQAVNGLVAAGTELQKKVTELQDQIDALDTLVSDATDADREQVEAEHAAARRVLVDQQALFKQRLDQLQVDTALTTGGAQVVRDAEQPEDPIEPTPIRTGALALVIGLLLGLGAAFLLDYLDDSIKSVEEMERAGDGMSVLAVIPLDPPPDNRPISISKPDHVAVEAYRGLRTSLQFLSLDADTRIIQVTSPMSGDGKTTTAANLAIVFAQSGRKVVLVDADLRKPRQHQVFGVPGTMGLTNALLGAAPELLVNKVQENLDLLAAGIVPPNPSEMLGSRQLRSLLETLLETYETIIIDSAPILPVTDSVALATGVHGVLLVGSAGKSTTKEIGAALSQLQRVHAPVLGTVLNKAGTRKKNGYSAYGGHGGYGAYGTYRQPVAEPTTGNGHVPTVDAPLADREPAQR